MNTSGMSEWEGFLHLCFVSVANHSSLSEACKHRKLLKWANVLLEKTTRATTRPASSSKGSNVNALNSNCLCLGCGENPATRGHRRCSGKGETKRKGCREAGRREACAEALNWLKRTWMPILNFPLSLTGWTQIPYLLWCWPQNVSWIFFSLYCSTINWQQTNKQTNRWVLRQQVLWVSLTLREKP